MIGFYGKFICPNCGKKFRQKIHVKKGAKPEDCQRVLWDGSIFHYHVHCPRCEKDILYRERELSKGEIDVKCSLWGK